MLRNTARLHIILITLIISFLTGNAFAQEERFWIGIKTKNKFDRTAVQNMGVSIESIVDDMSYGFAPESVIKKLKESKFETTKAINLNKFSMLDFPRDDAAYHNYDELTVAMREVAASRSDLVSMFSIGNTLQGRKIWALRFNNNATDIKKVSGKPAMIIVGGHHAREHLSVEVPLLFAKHLAENYGSDETITRLLDTRELFIVPNLNPDGGEWDISTGKYKMWRKNRRVNNKQRRDRCMGVDLNRNYSFKFASGGASNNPCSDTYHGPKPFSEPETKAFKEFVESRHNATILLSIHTFSELILYPWGHKYDPVENETDRRTLETMAQTMARWNRYTPQQSSDLYIASGVTQDWAYGDRGLIAFTFELSPKSMWNGGFYPGAGMIQKAFQDNLRPMLYMLDLTDNPRRSFTKPATTLFYGD